MFGIFRQIIKLIKSKRKVKRIFKNKLQIHGHQIRNNKDKKINIVFVCHRPAIWRYLKSIFEACINDQDFNVTIVAIPNKKQDPILGLVHEKYESEGAESFFKSAPCTVINGYDYEKNEWFDLKRLNPDYIFFQTPYNICRCEPYSSKNVSTYAQICYFHYGFSMLEAQSVVKEFAEEFLQYAYFIFAETEFHRNCYLKYIGKCNSMFDHNHVILVGQTAFDNIEKYKNSESSIWKHAKHEKYRILRTPRWTSNENNCTYSEYKDVLFDYCEKNDCDYIFRPHPQAFLNYIAEGLITQPEIEEMMQRYKKSNNCAIDTGATYLETLYSSDVLVSDPSGIVFEYIMTGKPIVYTEKDNEWANDFARRVIIEGSYRVKNEYELVRTLDMLRAGEDPLYDKRQQIIEDNFYINPRGAGNTIKEIIKRDFYGQVNE